MPSISLIFEALLALHVLTVLWVTADSVRRGCAPAYIATTFATSLLIPVKGVRAYMSNRRRPIGANGRPMSTAALSVERAREMQRLELTKARGVAAQLGLPPGVNVSDMRSLEAAHTAGFIDDEMFASARGLLLAAERGQGQAETQGPAPAAAQRPYVAPVALSSEST